MFAVAAFCVCSPTFCFTGVVAFVEHSQRCLMVIFTLIDGFVRFFFGSWELKLLDYLAVGTHFLR